MLTNWTFFDHPADFPNSYVARKFINAEPTDEVVVVPTLKELRRIICRMDGSLTCVRRLPEDHPCIIEVWLYPHVKTG